MKNISSSIIIGFAIIISFTILGLFLTSSLSNGSIFTFSNHDVHRYELIPANDNNLIIFDKQTGEYWNKYIPSDGGPTNWEKGDTPILNKE